MGGTAGGEGTVVLSEMLSQHRCVCKKASVKIQNIPANTVSEKSHKDTRTHHLRPLWDNFEGLLESREPLREPAVKKIKADCQKTTRTKK